MSYLSSKIDGDRSWANDFRLIERSRRLLARRDWLFERIDFYSSRTASYNALLLWLGEQLTSKEGTGPKLIWATFAYLANTWFIDFFDAALFFSVCEKRLVDLFPWRLWRWVGLSVLLDFFWGTENYWMDQSCNPANSASHRGGHDQRKTG